MNEEIDTRTVAFFVGLVFSAMTLTYNQFESEKPRGAPEQIRRQKWLVRTLAICCAFGLIALTLLILAKLFSWSFGNDLMLVAFLAVVITSLYVVIVCFRRTFD